MTGLRQYQARATDSCERAWAAGSRRNLLVLPTGAGKTRTAAHMASRVVEQGGQVLWVVHRSPLVPQAADALRLCGLDPGFIKAGMPEDRDARLQIASVQSLMRRERPPADLVVIDECHRRDFDSVHQWYTATKILGLTATPIRMGGKTLHGDWDTLVHGATYRELLDDGFIVPPRVWSPEAPELDKIEKTQGGDFKMESAAAQMTQPGLVGSVVAYWAQLCAGEPTLVFATNLHHAQLLATDFAKAGASAEIVDASTPDEERMVLQARLAQGNLDVIVNVQIYVEGVDIPELRNVIIARPTESEGLWMQMCNRGCRPMPGKTFFRLIDHSGGIWMHLSPQADKPWSLDPNTRRTVLNGLKAPPLRQCKQCFYIFGPRESGGCPSCGQKEPPRFVKYQKGGKLVEITDKVPLMKQAKRPLVMDPREKERRRLWAVGSGMRVADPHQFVRDGLAKFDFKQMDSKYRTVEAQGRRILLPTDVKEIF